MYSSIHSLMYHRRDFNVTSMYVILILYFDCSLMVSCHACLNLYSQRSAILNVEMKATYSNANLIENHAMNAST